MRMRAICVVGAACLAMPLAADELSPEAHWTGIYQSYWDDVATYNDCAENAAFCADSIRQRCEELWFVRNQFFNTAGQCFRSPLGQVMFDNADCTTEAASLGSFHTEYVAHTRTEEKVLGCAVNTSAIVPLDIQNLTDRMNAYPFLGGDAAPSGCLGWMGAAFALLEEPRVDAPFVAEVQAGDDLALYLDSFSHPGAFWYYGVFDDDGARAEGWGAVPVFPPNASGLCESYAG